MISIVGVGRVGASIAFLCASNSLDDIVLVNRTKDKAEGETMDISNAIPQNSNISVIGTDDYSKITGSHVVVITASTSVYTNNRSENIDKQVLMIKDIARKINQYCPNAVVLIVSNPLDVLTYFFQKECPFLRNKVIGVASSLDSSRFRYLLSKKFGVHQSQISDAMVLGEHGDTMVPVFSRVKIDGKSLSSMIKSATKKTLTSEVRNYWKSLRKYKSRSQFGIAKNTFDVICSVLRNKELSIPASVMLKGEFGESDVCMGVPVIINKNGITKIQEITLNNEEQKMLADSAQSIKKYIKSV
ncbi:MAG: lactate dehydrogenase [Nitrosarchaeum sp.]|nr:lactate dehydrogenase [Nitrosarchaeum sp.]